MKYTDVVTLMSKTAVDWRGVMNKVKGAAKALPGKLQDLNAYIPTYEQQMRDRADAASQVYDELANRTRTIGAALGVPQKYVSNVEGAFREVAQDQRDLPGEVLPYVNRAKTVMGELTRPMEITTRAQRQAARRAEMQRLQENHDRDAWNAWKQGFGEVMNEAKDLTAPGFINKYYGTQIPGPQRRVRIGDALRDTLRSTRQRFIGF